MEVDMLGINRNDLAKIFANFGLNRGAEIGVEKGNYSEVLCGANKKIHLYCIDPWEAYPEYKAAKNHLSFDDNYRVTQEKLKSFNCEIIRKKSSEAVKDFSPGDLDFVYIDGNHQFEYVRKDLDNWSKIVRYGGIISGHDYSMKEVKRAVNSYVEENSIEYLFLIAKGRDSSWFFINKYGSK